ncbi:MAG TPA: ferredoxin--NADP reductase, partial [Acidimicrobiales bacterium]|nr:ferredoxin--NADP reductase [Acidimicrobiales bacterium]
MVECESSGIADPVASRFCTLRIKRVVPETSDAASLVLEAADGDAPRFAYRPGQYVTLRPVIDGVAHLRSYSMSSSPAVDPELQVTVKRVPDGLVSNWLLDELHEGDPIEAMPPTGTFTTDESDRPLVALAAGSGITPIFSILKDVLFRPGRSSRLLLANRDHSSAIFGGELDALARRFPDRFVLQFHTDEDSGFVGPAEVERFISDAGDGDFYLCGPWGFMETVEAVLRTHDVEESRIKKEVFTPSDALDIGTLTTESVANQEGASVTISMGREQVTVRHRPGTTILQTARFAGLRAPSSCETGSCATCMARV